MLCACAPAGNSGSSICVAPQSETRLPAEVPAKTASALDSINDVKEFAHAPVKIPRSGYLTIAGWAYDSQVRLPAAAVYLDIDREMIPAQYGLSRPDVALATRNAALDRTGFAAVIPWECIGKARHTLTLKIVNHQETASYSGTTVEFIAEGAESAPSAGVVNGIPDRLTDSGSAAFGQRVSCLLLPNVGRRQGGPSECARPEIEP